MPLRPSVPRYRCIAQSGPTNSRAYTVAVYHRRRRLATADAPTVQEAEMRAAQRALDLHAHTLFTHLNTARTTGDAPASGSSNNARRDVGNRRWSTAQPGRFAAEWQRTKQAAQRGGLNGYRRAPV
jgi:hypothetical protein